MNTQVPTGLSESIPANNQKIVEIYNKLRGNQIIIDTSYQRKLVWKNTHKFNFIDTILRNYPFPEIYLAPGKLDSVEITLTDEIVDGQQRLTTIRNYIEGLDVFALKNVPIPRFSELTPLERAAFLNYEVSVRYLKNVSKDQVKEIFQRINKTDYALNSTERTNAQWGESEFVCFAKQVVDPGFQAENTIFLIEESKRSIVTSFFHGDTDDDESVFTTNDMSRMLAYQYVMALVATMLEGTYFRRNDKVLGYIENYNSKFDEAADVLERLLSIIDFINSMNLERFSRWFNKANLFTLIIELDRADLTKIDAKEFSLALDELDLKISLNELGIAGESEKLTPDEEKYLNFTREAVNQKHAREFRGEFIRRIMTCS